MNTERLRQLIRERGAEPISYKDQQLLEFESFLGKADIADYLRNCQTKEDYEASGIYIGGDLEVLRKANFDLAPGALLFPHGFLSIASDVGGNEVCVDARTAHVHFAPHGSFDEQMVYTRDERTGELTDLPGLHYANIIQGLVLLSQDFEQFLVDLLNDRLTATLDDLD